MNLVTEPWLTRVVYPPQVLQVIQRQPYLHWAYCSEHYRPQVHKSGNILIFAGENQSGPLNSSKFGYYNYATNHSVIVYAAAKGKILNRYEFF